MGVPDRIRRDLVGYGGGGGKDGSAGSSATEAPDSLRNTSIAKIVDLISTGPIVGPVNGYQSIFVNDTPLQNADGSMNVNISSIDFRSGTQTQDYIPGFSSVENEIAVGVELRSSTAWVQAFSNLDLSAVRLRLSVSGLSKADTSTGDINGYYVEYAIDLATDGGSYQTVMDAAFDGKTTSEYQRSVRINLGKATTGWSIRVRRITPNANSASIADKTNVVSYTEIIDAKFRYPMAAVMGIQVDARQYQNIPTRSYRMQGRIIRVPDNYDPVARTYTGIWTGNFKLAYTNNPAWIMYDLMTHDIYGLGKRITDAQIDKWGLYNIGVYCDQMVSNGRGGLEPRYTCNLYVQKQVAAYKLLQDIASIFNGLAYWAGGQIVVTCDMPADPDFTYTAANVLNGVFKRVGSAKRTRYTVALVSWNDLTDNGRQKVESVFDTDGIKRYGIVQTQISAFGCTSQSEAQRKGRRALLLSKLLTDAITFSVSLDYLRTKPGGIIRISDPARMGRRNGGRIRTATTNTVTLDKAPLIAAGDKLTCHLPTGIPETQIVLSVSGDTVTIASTWSVVPQAESIWSVDNADLVVPLAKVVSIKEKGKLEFEITAVSHEPSIYSAIDSGTKINPAPQTVVPSRYQVPPKNVRFSTYVTTGQGVSYTTLIIAWDAADKAVGYTVQWRRNNGEWVDAGQTSSLSVEVRGIYAGTYVARVIAVNSIKILSQPFQTNPIYVSANSIPLPTVPNVGTNFISGLTQITWDVIVDFRQSLVDYEIRIGPTWASAQVLGRTSGTNFTAVGDGTYWIAAHYLDVGSSSDIYSSPPASIVIAGATLTKNVIQAFSEAATGWSGVLSSNTAVLNGELILSGIGNILAEPSILTVGDVLWYGGIAASGEYDLPAAHTINISRVAPCNVLMSYTPRGQSIHDNVLNIADFLNVSDLLGAALGANVNIQPQIATAGANGIFGAWQNFVPGIYNAKHFKARVLLASNDPQVIAVLSDLLFSVDVPDRLDAYSATTGTGPVAVNFTPQFNGGPNGMSVPVVQATILNAQAGDDFQLSSIGVAGCTIQVVNAGAIVVRNVNLQIQGY